MANQCTTFHDLIDEGLRPSPELDPALQPLPTNLRGIPVTFASMIMTDGKTTHIGVYRGLMIGDLRNRYIDRNVDTTVHIATEVVMGGNTSATWSDSAANMPQRNGPRSTGHDNEAVITV